MNYRNNTTLSIFISAVWVINGLFCKVLNYVPRHELIVARILGNNYSREITIAIGISETAMAVWILTGFKSKINAITQVIIIASMNVLELILAPDLLLWGKFNFFFALLFIGIVYYNAFVLSKKYTS